MMTHVVVKAFGGPEQLQISSAKENAPVSPGEVLVDVEAAGINYLDVYQRKGVSKATLPFRPGLEGVGRVRATAPGTSGGAGAPVVGKRIAWVSVPGSYASQVAVPVDQAILVPESFTTSQALLFQALTAQYLVNEYRDVQPGDRVLVHSAAGGVGQLLVQWLKHLGAWVVGTTSTDRKAAAARAAGADAVINYGSNYAFLEDVVTLTDGRGVDLAFDAVGAATLPASLKALARGGTLVSFGSASGPPSPVDPRELIKPCIRLAGGSLFSYIAEPAELQRRAAAAIEGIRAGWLRVDDGHAYELSRVADAHRDLEGRKTQGKLYLIPRRLQ